MCEDTFHATMTSLVSIISILLRSGEMRTPTAAVSDSEDADVDANLKLALGLGPHKEDSSVFQQRLARVQQMTGLAVSLAIQGRICGCS